MNFRFESLLQQIRNGVLFAFTLLGPGWLLAQTCSIPAQGAAATISTAPNTNFPGTTANLAAGSAQIALGAGTGLNAAINPGDLLLIIQMQGATINSDNTNQYGDSLGSGAVEDNTGNAARGSSANTAGTYEFAVATNSVAFAGVATVNLSAPLQTASIAGFQAPYSDSLPGNNSSTASTTLDCNANLSVTKSNGVTSPTAVVAGSTTTYTVTFANAGASSADNAVVRDMPSAGLANCSVTACSASGGNPVATCPVPGNWPNFFAGGGLLLPNFPSASSINFTVSCGVSATGL